MAEDRNAELFHNHRRAVLQKLKPVAAEARADWWQKFQDFIQLQFPEATSRVTRPGIAHCLFGAEIALPSTEKEWLIQLASNIGDDFVAHYPEVEVQSYAYPDRLDAIVEFVVITPDGYVTCRIKLRNAPFRSEDGHVRREHYQAPRPRRRFDEDTEQEGGDDTPRPVEAEEETAMGEVRPRPEYNDRPRRDYGDRPQRPWQDRGDRPQRPWQDRGDRPQRPWQDRGDRPQRPWQDRGDRPQRPWQDRGDRPQRPWQDRGDRPQRPWQDRGDRPQRPWQDRGDRPQRPWQDRGDRPQRPWQDRGDRPQRPWQDRGDRPQRPWQDRGDRPQRPWQDRGDRPQRPWQDRGDRPQRDSEDRGDRPYRSSNNDQPFQKRSFRPDGDGERPAFGDRKPFKKKPFGKPAGGGFKKKPGFGKGPKKFRDRPSDS